ncbi:hypothetical protein BCV69DRAFT_284297 [Microstroma glucosiphilum]|uniref:Uncharacterized protein n=1 Tax=Pseudomicrostroma glucosiphilum TaxID=1684307 RepID=A0A316U180_9BASI|nr:hypothetical protein BCV69DRAFT_284297 [Pseudomicrostroma glucosiphilum]PWN19139.1 hypothetical protein BCV69DRAFT_284297 [Pseudomicrostroma glucosiphilum]
MTQILTRPTTLESAATEQALGLERRHMLERTRPTDASTPSLRELFQQQQHQLDLVAAASAAAAASSTMSNATTNGKSQGNRGSQRFSLLRFNKASPSTAAPPAHFRYVKAKNSNVAGAAPEGMSVPFTSPAAMSGSAPVTPPTPTSTFSSVDGSSPDTPPLSLSSTSSPALSTQSPALPITMAKVSSPPEQSVFEWSPNNSPKHLRSYMTEFLGAGSAHANAKTSARSRPNTLSAQPKTSPAPAVKKEESASGFDTAKSRNRKGSVSAIFLPGDLPADFLAASRDMEVVARRTRRMSSVDTTGGSDLESWTPARSNLNAIPPTPPLRPKSTARTVSSASTLTLRDSNIPLPVFGGTTLRELRRRNTTRKPDGLKVIVTQRSPSGMSESTITAPTVPLTITASSSDNAMVDGRSAGYRALSPTVPSRGGSLYLTKGRESKSRSPNVPAFPARRDNLSQQSDTDRDFSRVGDGLLFSSLDAGLAPAAQVSLPRFSKFFDLSSEIMESLQSAQSPSTVSQSLRPRASTVSSGCSEYGGFAITTSSPIKSRKNSIIALPDADWEGSSRASMMLMRNSATALRPRRGSILQRLKLEATMFQAPGGAREGEGGRNRSDSVPSVYSMASAEGQSVAEEAEGEAIGLTQDEEEPVYSAPIFHLPEWQGTAENPSGRRLSLYATPITDATYRAGLRHSRPSLASIWNWDEEMARSVQREPRESRFTQVTTAENFALSTS